MGAFTDRMYVLEYKEQVRQAEKRRKEREMEQRKKEIEEIAKKKEQEKEQKEYNKTICLAITQELRYCFEQEFTLQGLKAKYNFYNIETRDTLIKSIAKTEFEGDFLEKNYNKILNEVIKKYELHEKYKEEQTNEIIQEEIKRLTPEWEKKAKQEKIMNIIYNILMFPFNHIIITLFVIFLAIFTWIFAEIGVNFLKALGLGFILEIVLIAGFLGFIK